MDLIPENFFIPAMHAYGHGEHCQLEFSRNWKMGIGILDGEDSERGWKECKFSASLACSRLENRIDSLVMGFEYQSIARNKGIIKNIEERLRKCQDNLVNLAVKGSYKYDSVDEYESVKRKLESERLQRIKSIGKVNVGKAEIIEKARCYKTLQEKLHNHSKNFVM